MTSEDADLGHIDTWLFDVDDTLYPAETQLLEMIRERITHYVMRLTGSSFEESRAIQRGWFLEHGAALPGLLAAHDVDPRDFLDDIHDVPLDAIVADPRLDAALARLPGRRLVFTNGSANHAARVLERIGIAHRFEGVFHIESGDMTPKPAPATFQAMIRLFGLTPATTAFFEDAEANLKHAAELGMTCVLVGPQSETSTARWIHHRSRELTPFLERMRVAAA